MDPVTPAEVLVWAGIDREPSTTDRAQLEPVIAAVTAVITERCIPLDEVDPEPGQVAAMRQAILMQSLRVWGRRNTPEGFAAGFTDMAPARISAVDPTVRDLIAPYRNVAP